MELTDFKYQLKDAYLAKYGSALRSPVGFKCAAAYLRDLRSSELDWPVGVVDASHAHRAEMFLSIK